MSVKGLNEVVGKAIISDSFRAGLMNGKRAELLRQFGERLDPDERQAVLAIQAHSFSDFAAAVERLIAQRERRPSAPQPETPALPSMRWSSLNPSGIYLHHE
jgi:hypothetical protein